MQSFNFYFKQKIDFLLILFTLILRVIRPMPVDENYYETKNQIIKAERRILKELGFCVYFKHPHKVR